MQVDSVPITVSSTTDDYFVLYVRHELSEDTTVELPVLVKKGSAGATILAENVAALPKDRYRVEKYLVSDPADIDGDCIDDHTELNDSWNNSPVNPAPAIEVSNGAVAIPDHEMFETLSHEQRHLKYVLIDMHTDRPGVFFRTLRRTRVMMTSWMPQASIGAKSG